VIARTLASDPEALEILDRLAQIMEGHYGLTVRRLQSGAIDMSGAQPARVEAQLDEIDPNWKARIVLGYVRQAPRG
jgi:hypothetical protein